MKNFFRIIIPCFLFSFCWCDSTGAMETDRWWSVQVIPKGVVKTPDIGSLGEVRSPNGKSSAGGLGANHVLLQSLSGLAAQAVNEGRSDEMVWLGLDNLDYHEWYKRVVQRLSLEERGTFEPWQLVKRYQDRGLIEGYILYSYDYSEGGLYEQREKLDESVNVATSLAGIMKAILVEEGQEAQAKQLGLRKVFDARGKTQRWCFENYRDEFNRNILCTQDPKVPHNRGLAIAHHVLTLYGTGELTRETMEWLEPLSPILGWNCGDEFSQTVLPSEYAHYQTATNWCLNLPILMAGSEEYEPMKIHALDPKAVNWDDPRCGTCFTMSDGDNVQWLMGAFFQQEKGSWWSSPDHGRFPFGWTGCLSELVQICPDAVNYAAENCPPGTGFTEFGGGYYYPDRFGKRREGKNWLAEHARRVWANMQKAGIRILTVNCHEQKSEDAMEAYRTYAKVMKGLIGIMSIQYTPYEAGAGEIIWVKNTEGIEIPVVTARYALWGNANNQGPRIGTPAKVARVINESVAAAKKESRRTYDWTIVHAWSFFKKTTGTDEEAENMDQAEAMRKGGVRGVTPVAWCVDWLSPNVRVICPEEMMWRIRMERNSVETRKILGLEPMPKE